jgi:hypothetical protein
MHQTEGIATRIKMQGHAGQLDTCLHWELGASVGGLTGLADLDHRTSNVMMTDIQTALALISIGLRVPERLRFDKHWDVVLQITQMLAACLAKSTCVR